MDTHLTTTTQYYDYMQGKLHGGWYLEPSLDFSFTPTPYLSLILHGSWRYITGVRGDTSELSVGSSSNSPKTYDNQAGAGYSAFDIGLFLKITLPLGFRKTSTR
jgi:outer membrane protease E